MPSAPTVTGMVFVFIFYILDISISRSLYLYINFSNSLAEILLSDGTFISINWHYLFYLSLITISGLLACIVLSVPVGKSQRMVTFDVSTTGNGLCSCHLSSVSISWWLHFFQCMYYPTWLCLFVYSCGGKNCAPWDEVVNSLGACITEPTPRVCPITLQFLVKRLWSCVGKINPSVSTLSPALLNHWWVSCKSTSAFLLWSGYWLCNGFDFQAVSIAFFPYSLAIYFNFQAFSVFLISPIKFSFKV